MTREQLKSHIQWSQKMLEEHIENSKERTTGESY